MGASTWRGPKRGAAIEWGVLGVVLAGALVLVAVALGPLGDASRAGEEALERIVRAARESVRAEWRRLWADRLLASSGDELTWPAAFELPPPRAEPVALSADDPDGDADFALLFAAARWRELQGGAKRLAEARELLERARSRASASAGQRALGGLRELQLTRRAGDPEETRAAFARVESALAPAWTVDGHPALALAVLAAAPELQADHRATLRARLEAAWAAGALALPPGEPQVRVEDGLRVELPASWRALRSGLVELAPEAAADPALERWLLAARVGALARFAGGLPALDEVPPEGWRRDTPNGTLVLTHVFEAAAIGGFHAVEPFGVLRADLVDPAELGAALEARVRASGRLPPGLEADFGGPESDAAPLVAGPASLWGDALAFTLRHPDPRTLVAAERRRALVLRVALLLVAALCAVMGALGFRALRRERKLRELKSAFVAGVSHELRTPLASILLMTENLETGRVTDDEARSRYVAQLGREARRLGRLVDGVLDVARLERGAGLQLRVEEVALRDYARELADELRAEAGARGGALEVELGELPERAALDVDALRRALWNLVDNALKHGGGAAELSLAVRDGRLVLALRDRGPGVPAAERARLMAPFERLDADAPGSGLGLAIAREIARAHGGELELRAPADGPGALVVLTLPLVDGGEET